MVVMGVPDGDMCAVECAWPAGVCVCVGGAHVRLLPVQVIDLVKCCWQQACATPSMAEHLVQL